MVYPYQGVSNVFLILLLKDLGGILSWTTGRRATAWNRNHSCSDRFGEIVFDIRDQRILIRIIICICLITGFASHHWSSATSKHHWATRPLHFTMNKCSSCLNIFYLTEKTANLWYKFLSFGILALIVSQLTINTFSVESMKARENVELFFKYAGSTKVTLLLWINSDMLVSLLSLFLSQFLSTLTVLR